MQFAVIVVDVFEAIKSASKLCNKYKFIVWIAIQFSNTFVWNVHWSEKHLLREEFNDFSDSPIIYTKIYSHNIRAFRRNSLQFFNLFVRLIERLFCRPIGSGLLSKCFNEIMLASVASVASQASHIRTKLSANYNLSNGLYKSQLESKADICCRIISSANEVINI